MSDVICITKEVTFDCAHMLSGHEGLCANLHGHTYKLQVSVTGEPLKVGPSEGMLLDFKDLKTIIQEVVLDKFDHATIISGAKYRNDAETTLLAFVRQFNMRHVELDCRSTAENMAAHFRREIWSRFRTGKKYMNISCVSIALWETPTSYAEV